MSPNLTHDALEESVEEVGLREANARLQSQLIKAKDRTQRLVNATKQAAYDAALAAGPIEPVSAPTEDKRTRSEEVAILDLGDWQGSKLTATYNSGVMEERVHAYCDKVEVLTESDNRYALTTMAASAIPSQRLNFVDPDRGRVTSSHKIWLD